MKPQGAAGVRGFWVGYALVMGMLTVGVWYQADEQFERELVVAKERVATEQAFIAALVHDLLQRGNFEDIQSVVSRWGADGADRVSLTVTAENGFELGRYVREHPPMHAIALESELEFGYGNRADLEFVGDVSAVYEEHARTLISLWLLVLLVAAFGAYLVRNIQRRKQEVVRYRLLSERFLAANSELEVEIEVRKRTEQALSDARESAEVTLNSIGDAVITADADGRVTRMNPIAERLTGWQREEAQGRRIDDVFCIQGSKGNLVENPVHQVLGRGRAASLANETVLVARSGRCTQIANNAAPIHGAKGSIDGVILVFRDVSEDYRMRSALVESETRFRRLVESLVDHFFMTQTGSGDIAYVSPSAIAMFGYTQAEFCAGFREFFTEYPGNIQFETRTKLTFDGCLQDPYTLELRTKSGGVRLVELRQVPVFDETGAVIAAESIAHDMTERRAADAEQRLAAAVFENSAEGIMVTDLSGKIQRVNRAFTQITGYAAEEAIGETPRLLQSGRQSPQFYMEMWAALVEHGHWQGEIWNRHKNDKVYPEWLSISRIPALEDGGEERYVGIFSDISRQKEAEKEISRLAFHDALTGLPNRFMLMERLDTDLARAERLGHLDALLFLDLDHFKHVNDSLGHGVGDAMLKEVARRLRENVRDYDMVARLGGDEFVVLINAVADNHHQALCRARRGAEKIRSALVEPMIIAGHELHSSASIGVALLPVDAACAEDALKYADKAMYQAKSSGRNTIQFFTLDMQNEAQQRLVLENELRRAIERDELALHYQPIVDFSTSRVAGLEALLRWRHPRHGNVSPVTFIPIAEETGLILPIGEWVLKTACAQACSWQDVGLATVYVSVNLSAVQFRQGDIARTIREVLRETGLDPTYLELELTESLLVENVGAAVRILDDLAKMGIGLSIDDFGTGYSSLSYLRKFSLHKLKIDRSFVEDLPDNPDATAITTTIVQMAHNLGLRTVAEGIENNAQLDYLRKQGCDFGQGYLCSMPLPAEEIPAFLSGGQHVAVDEESMEPWQLSCVDPKLNSGDTEEDG